MIWSRRGECVLNARMELIPRRGRLGLQVVLRANHALKMIIASAIWTVILKKIKEIKHFIGKYLKYVITRFKLVQ